MEVNKRRYPAVGRSIREIDRSDEVIMSIQTAVVSAARRKGLRVSEILNLLVPEQK